MASLLTEYHRTDPDDMHPALALARYGKRRDADAFLGLWLTIVVEAQQIRPNVRSIRRHVDRFYAVPAISTALEEAGQASFDAELADAARVYYASGLEDVAYTSTMLRMRRLSAAQVRDKAALEVVRATAAILDAGLDTRLVRCLAIGFLEALAPHGAQELHDASARHPRARELLTAVVEERR